MVWCLCDVACCAVTYCLCVVHVCVCGCVCGACACCVVCRLVPVAVALPQVVGTPKAQICQEGTSSHILQVVVHPAIAASCWKVS